MRTAVKLKTLLAALLLPIATFGMTCSSGSTGGVAVSWCLQEAGGGDFSRVLWYLHGANQDETTFLNSTAYTNLAADWAANGTPQPAIIAVSLGPLWLLTDVPSTYVSGAPTLLSFFTSNIVPYVEAQTGVTPTHRWAFGVSMGGYNVAQLLAHDNGVNFEKIVVGCPALTTVNKFSAGSAVTAYENRTQVLDSDVQYLFGLIEHDTSVVADWNRNDPLQQLRYLQKDHASAFVWWNRADIYGMFEGGVGLANWVQVKRGSATTQMSVPGPHCDTSQTDSGKSNVLQTIATFLSP